VASLAQETTKRASTAFVSGAAVLTVAGLICKLLGMYMRAKLTSQSYLTPYGMGIYQYAYPVYQWLVAISTAGLPAAIAQRVAARMAEGNPQGAHAVFVVSRRLLVALGLVFTILMMALAPAAGALLKMPDAVPGMIALAPSLFFVAVICAYRGYFQGLQRMGPTAVSQIIEQAVQVVLALVLVRLFISKGIVIAAAMALIGASAAEACAMWFMTFLYRNERKNLRRTRPMMRRRINQREVLKDLLSIALPISIGAMLMPLTTSIDSVIFTRSLLAQGYGSIQVASFYSILTNDAQTLTFMPAVMTVAISLSMLPAISDAMTQKNSQLLARRASTGFKLLQLFTLPCVAGLMVLANPFMHMLYGDHTPEQIILAARFMLLLSPGLFFLGLMQNGNAILQGMGRPRIPVRNLLFGALIKVVWDIALIRHPGYTVYGAPLATTACYALVAILNLMDIRVVSEGAVRFNWRGMLAPLGASAVMAVVVGVCYKLLHGWMGGGYTIPAMISAILGVAVYLVCVILLRGVTPEDLDMMPGGKFLKRFLPSKTKESVT